MIRHGFLALPSKAASCASASGESRSSDISTLPFHWKRPKAAPSVVVVPTVP